jgi:choline-phosphate cytidylyltransferase
VPQSRHATHRDHVRNVRRLPCGPLRVLERATVLGVDWRAGCRLTRSMSAREVERRCPAERSGWPLWALRIVDEVFVEDSLEENYILQHSSDVLVMGDDWAGKFDDMSEVCEVVYPPRTPVISTTAIIEHIVDL